jgi:hypothetical protein
MMKLLWKAKVAVNSLITKYADMDGVNYRNAYGRLIVLYQIGEERRYTNYGA